MIHATASQHNINLEDWDVQGETDDSMCDWVPPMSAVDSIPQSNIDGLRVPSTADVKLFSESLLFKAVHKHKRGKRRKLSSTSRKRKVARKGLRIQDLVDSHPLKARIHNTYTDGYIDGHVDEHGESDGGSVSDNRIAYCRDVDNIACANKLIKEGKCSPKENGERQQAGLATKKPVRQVTQCQDSCDKDHVTSDTVKKSKSLVSDHAMQSIILMIAERMLGDAKHNAKIRSTGAE